MPYFYIKFVFMGRFLKILFYIFLLTFVFIWFSTVIKSCNNPVPAVVQATEEAAETIAQEKDEFFEDGESDGEVDNYDFDNSNETDEIDYNEIDENLEKLDQQEAAATQPAQTNTSTSNNTQSYESSNSGSTSGRFLVITGSYLVKSNAQSMTSKLANMGYNNAEIVVFNDSQYNSVVAARYSSYETAVEEANALKRKGIDAYVHRRK